jgi:hypothetical protein
MTLVQTRVELKLEQTQQKQQEVYLKHQPHARAVELIAPKRMKIWVIHERWKEEQKVVAKVRMKVVVQPSQ